ncbi:F-box only protein 36-like isoform X1 [Carcharodon carcharias]|uniref:F-box only protein 36-like isoform X1 n=1 Tax=Carcharodon carcharias TaxID=13397 RepID=UPI001B7F1A05|nr:F-box only protein 36-like isoform X1 [Carcharodon carcharias]
MASLCHGTLFEIRAQAPAPSKDYHQLLVTDSEVIWRWWKISLRSEFRNVYPGEQKNSYQDFLDDNPQQVHVGVIFGNEVLKYVCNLCQHQFDYLNRIPEGLLMYIISFLELEDIARFSQTSRKFETACNSDKLWEHIVSRYCDTITPEMKALALEVGWKEIFFTNKLQLQKKIRRRRQKVEEFADYMTI